MKEQIYVLKSKLATAEDALKRYKCNDETELLKELVPVTQKELRTCLNIAREDLKVKDKDIEHAETELKELGSALRLYEEENSRLAEERDHWIRVAKDFETRVFASPESEEKRAEFRYYETRVKELQTELNYVKSLPGQKHADLAVQKMEEQLQLANKRYQTAFRRADFLEKETLELRQKSKILEQDRKKYADRWQGLVGRIKSDDHLRNRIKDLESAGNQLIAQLESAISLNQDLESKLLKSERNRSKEFATVRKSASEQRVLTEKLKAILEENDMLSLMNKELAMRLKRCEDTRTDVGVNMEKERNLVLMEEIERLRKEVRTLRHHFSRSTAASPDTTPKKVGKRTEESLGSLVKSLKEAAESPLHALKDSDTEVEVLSSRREDPSVPVYSHLDSLSSRVQTLESERKALKRQLATAQAIINGVSESRSMTPVKDVSWSESKETSYRSSAQVGSKSSSPNRSFQTRGDRRI